MESFSTPWHGVLYSGYAASTAWLCWSAWSHRRRLEVAGFGWWRWIPTGYAPALAGAGLFLISGLGDLSWHLAFGVERGIAALLDAAQYHFVNDRNVTVGGAGVVEALLVVLRPGPAPPPWPRRRRSAFCVLAPAAFRGVYLGGIAMSARGLGWPLELWGGAIVWSGFTVLAVALAGRPGTAPSSASGSPARYSRSCVPRSGHGRQRTDGATFHAELTSLDRLIAPRPCVGLLAPA